MKRFVVTLILSCLAFWHAYSQGYEEMIRSNPAMAAANLMNYHYEKTSYTPAPKGYKPFYITHYGRHGSRYDATDEYVSAVWSVMKEADSLELFTDAGKAFYKEFSMVMSEQAGMFGMLTTLGADEHRGIAARMARNFPDVFSGKNGRKNICCQSSIVPRCIVSMTNFAHSLDRHTDGMEFTFVTGDKFYNHIAYRPTKQLALKLAREKESELRRATMQPMRLIEYFFSDPERVCKLAGDPYVFERNLYLASCVGHLTDCGACLLRHFPIDVLVKNWEVRNRRFYLAYGMSAEMAEYQKQITRRVLADFLSRAEEAVDNGNTVAADLRFGHDTALLPLVGHIAIDGMDKKLSFDEVNGVWNSSVSICMGSNLQMVFYKNKKGDVLVKLLYNEKETTIPALSTFSGPYYKWSDLKKYLYDLL